MNSGGNKFRFGLIGGGEGSFIGQVHRLAAEMDSQAELVCGAFSSDADRSRRSGVELYGLPSDRAYPSFTVMLSAEAKLPSNERMQFVVIATPNHVHYPAALAALEAGYHVVCDKPVTFSLAQAQSLRQVIAQTGLQFAVTYNYTGYPMVKEARALVTSGALGSIRRVSCEYLQGWLAETLDSKQAAWRTDPQQAGAAGCFGDIGTHAENLVSYVSGLNIESLCADLSAFVSGRRLDDDGNVLLRFVGGARGVLSTSQVAVGKENDLTIQVYGEKGGLEWKQSDANSLVVRWIDRPSEVRRTGGPGLSDSAVAAARTPAGHPEGYLEAFANIYRNFYLALNGRAADLPTIEDGVRGMRFIERVVTSSERGAQWVNFESEAS
jgi:predicted dehydrogenase